MDAVFLTFKLNGKGIGNTGLRGLYKGLPLGITSSTLYFYLYYGIYNNLGLQGFPELLSGACFSSLLTTLLVYPLDTIKYSFSGI